jgi:hypothetical protein
MKATDLAFGATSDPGTPTVEDAETGMRLSLGLGTASSSAPTMPSPNDPMKGARQAIRSQAAAKEYVERQLVHAETTIQELRTKLHHACREKDTAAEAARLATAAKIEAQHTLIVTETAPATEKAARDRGDRALREAQATIRLLQAKPDDVARRPETAKAELAAERQVRQKADDLRREVGTAREGAGLRPGMKRSRRRFGDQSGDHGRRW